MKTAFPKAKPRVVYYRSGIKDIENFRKELRTELRESATKSYAHFEITFKKVLDKFDPIKQKVVRDNDKPFMTKILRKAIMRRSALKNRFLKTRSDVDHQISKKHKNYTNRLYKREKKKYAANLDLKKLTDNKKFWDIILPLISSKGKGTKKITLVDNDEIISDDKQIADLFSDFFVETVASLDIEDNEALLNNVDHLSDPVQKALLKFKDHPSIREIKKNVCIDSEFFFKKVSLSTMVAELRALDGKKSGTYKDLPVKVLKEHEDIVALPLTEIWNEEIVQNRKFADKLKLADITPLN